MTKAMTTAYVLFNANGDPVNRILLATNHNWQPPEGYTLQPDVDGQLWKANETVAVESGGGNWQTFKRELLNNEQVKEVLMAVLPLEPVATLALPTTLLIAANSGDYDDFCAVWLKLRRQKLMPQSLLNELSALAEACNLPPGIVRVIGGAVQNTKEV